MLKIYELNKNKVIEQINNKVLDAIVPSNSNLIDDIIHSMHQKGILDCLEKAFDDKKKHNSFMPFNFLMALAIATKMKTRMRITDMPVAIRDYHTLRELGYAAINTSTSDDLLTQKTNINKYTSEDLVDYYNQTVQEYIFKQNDICPNIHILDCTKIDINSNYENIVISFDQNTKKNYTLSSLRGIVGEFGIIEEVKLGLTTTHDIALNEEMIKNSKCLHDGDILVMDKNFISRDFINDLKRERYVDTYLQLKKNLELYDFAVGSAEILDDWKPHPTKEKQMISLVNHIGEFWQGNLKNDVDLNACVIWSMETQSYNVIVTTDLTKSAQEIILTYQFRPEIRADLRQLNTFWQLENDKCKQLNILTFHIICTLFAYLFFQLYLALENSIKITDKYLLMHMNKEQFFNYLVLYSGDYFCIMSLKEFIEFNNSCDEEIKDYLLKFLK